MRHERKTETHDAALCPSWLEVGTPPKQRLGSVAKRVFNVKRRWGVGGIEPPTSRKFIGKPEKVTRSENHTTRPNSLEAHMWPAVGRVA